VRYTLEPLVYKPGPAQGADANAWKLRSAAELLELQICDMAMGSGAFLVASCRYLTDRLVEAWGQAGGGPVTIEGEAAAEKHDALLVPDDPDDREVLARRLVADRCLYGVDKNPMAVEMAKLSMWLITLAKDRPFSFVDHALRCGDSLLGITDLAQIENLHINPARGRELFHGQLFDYRSILAPAVEDAIAKRRALEGFTVITLRDAQEKERLFHEVEHELKALKVVADVVVGAAISTASQGEDALDSRLVGVADDVATALDPERKDSERKVRLESLYWDAVDWLNAGRPIMHEERGTFHWPLEFPEVFVRGGFDAFVGNPPFLGGTRISRPLGSDYRAYLGRHIAGMRTDRADLCAFFFLRAGHLVRDDGTFGLLAINTISEGDTRAASLAQLVHGFAIYRATKSRPWPGMAVVEVAQLWLKRGSFNGPLFLNDSCVRRIDPSLTVGGRVKADPKRLAANRGLSFEGTTVYGEGFLLDDDEARALIAHDPKNAAVVHPYLSGKDLTTSPTQSASRWVINLSHLTLEQAQEYSECFNILRERVYPERAARQGTRYKNMVERWWWFLWPRKQLYDAIAPFTRVVALCKVGRTQVPVFVTTRQVLSNRLAVFVFDDLFHLGVLSGDAHRQWALRMGSTLRTDPVYTTRDCFETFPLPEFHESIEVAMAALDEHRRTLMLDRDEGLTGTHNRLNNPHERDSDIEELRRLHVELDYAIGTAYGWDDLDLDHGFLETPHGTRYTLGPVACAEVVDRLLELNQERYAVEVAAGLHDKKKGAKRKGSRVAVGDQTALDGMP
jgi:hypothetical protein